MAISLVVHAAETERAIRRLRDRAPIAMLRALNKSIASAKTAMVREVSQDMGLKSSEVRDRMWVREASIGDRVARLYASAKPVPLMDFGARGPEPSRGKGHGVTAKLTGGARRYPQAFLATMRTGHRGVFQRSDKTARKSQRAWSMNLPIYELHGPSIAFVFQKHVQVGLARGQEQLVKNLRSEFRFAMGKSA